MQRLVRTAAAASRVREPTRFAWRELRGKPRTDVYRLRQADLKILNRHPLLDMWTLEEVMRSRVYEFPPPLVARIGALDGGPRIADLGGHVGTFGLFALSAFPAAHIVSFEPDPRNGEVLARCIAENGKEDDWELVRACAATEDGETDFVSGFHLSGTALMHASMEEDHRSIEEMFPFLRDRELMRPEKVRVPTRDVFPYLAAADVIKMDIEGTEWELMEDPRFAELSAAGIVLEYHGAACPEPDPHAYLERLLRNAGYEIGPGIPGVRGEGVLWGLRAS